MRKPIQILSRGMADFRKALWDRDRIFWLKQRKRLHEIEKHKNTP